MSATTQREANPLTTITQQTTSTAACWCCDNADEAWHCSACGGHGDDGRVPVDVRCPDCKGTGKARFRDAMSGQLICQGCDQLVELVDPDRVHAALRLPEDDA